MPSFSKTSKARLETCDPRLQKIMNEAIKTFDFTVICGHRTKEEQDKALAAKTTKAKWPTSKHNSYPSRAVDIAPYPIDWKNLDRFIYLAGHIQGIAHMMGIKIRWGGDWNRDKNTRDETFLDMPHFELDE